LRKEFAHPFLYDVWRKQLQEISAAELSLQQIEAHLADWTTRADPALQPLIENTTRKIDNIDYVEFVGLASMLMQATFRKRHWEIIADMVAVLFDREVSGDSIRLLAKDWAARRKTGLTADEEVRLALSSQERY
jgi:hypothetical protein